MSRKFFDTLRRYEEVLIYMSGMAHVTKREAWQGGPESDRARCARALDEVTNVWSIGYEQQLARLQQLNQRCLDQYAQGDLEAGDFTVKDIQELLAKLRDEFSIRSERSREGAAGEKINGSAAIIVRPRDRRS
jgi:hypothetical protein